MANELKALEGDYESLKTKLDAAKARNKVLTTELRTLKQQLSTVLEKGRHDDELIAALMVRAHPGHRRRRGRASCV